MTRVWPTRVELHDGRTRLVIGWSDGRLRHYAAGELRAACPCATCREKRSQPPAPTLLPILKPEEAVALSIVDVRPVGNYAYALSFSDGHDTGIYTLDVLRELGHEADGA